MTAAIPTQTPSSGAYDVLRAFCERYRDEPVLFVEEVLGATPDEWQALFLRAIARGERRISARSGHGVGKSTAAAWAAIWFVTTRYPARVVITAPTAAQLFDALFAEVKVWVRNGPPALRQILEVKSESIHLRAQPDASYISARTSRAEQPEALQGIHADYVLLIADEASGIPEAVFEAASGSMSSESATMVLLGNPVRTSGLFYRSHTDQRDKWCTFHISCIDSPRVSREFIEEMKDRYGEDTNAYSVRVLGEFPRAEDDTIIPMELIESACRRDIAESPLIKPVWGLDVAHKGMDSSVLIKRRGTVVSEIPREWRGLDNMQLAGAVKNEYDEAQGVNRPGEILIDSIGFGAGVVDRLRELGLPVRGINVGELPAMKTRFLNLRTELLFTARDWFEKRDCRIPNHPKLIAELTCVRYKFSSTGKTQAEAKDNIRARLKRSPDFGDAFCLTFAANAATGLHGFSNSSKWGQPLKRNVGGVC